MNKISLLAILISITLSSCSNYAHYYQSGSTPLAKTSSASVKVFVGNIEQDYQVIGSVTVSTSGGTTTATKYLKWKAAELGADAVINVELSKMNSYSGRVGLSGVAVKLK